MKIPEVPRDKQTVPGPILSPAKDDGLSPVAATSLQAAGMLYLSGGCKNVKNTTLFTQNPTF